MKSNTSFLLNWVNKSRKSGFESDSSISAENDFSNDKKVSTHKSLFAIDLLGDFIVLNIPTILCTLDIAKKKRN